MLIKRTSMSGKPYFTVTFIIQGESFDIEVSPNQVIKVGATKAVQPGSIEGWEVRTKESRVLDIEKKFSDEGIDGPITLYLSKGAGRGGSIFQY